MRSPPPCPGRAADSRGIRGASAEHGHRIAKRSASAPLQCDLSNSCGRHDRFQFPCGAAGNQQRTNNCKLLRVYRRRKQGETTKGTEIRRNIISLARTVSSLLSSVSAGAGSAARSGPSRFGQPRQIAQRSAEVPVRLDRSTGDRIPPCTLPPPATASTRSRRSRRQREATAYRHRPAAWSPIRIQWLNTD